MSVSNVTQNQANYSSPDLTGLDNENTSNIDYESCAPESDSGKITHGSVSTSKENRESVKNNLYALCAKDPLIMFLNGSAGVGKTTAVKLAQSFFFGFFRAVSMILNNRTFVFTSYTGSTVCALEASQFARQHFSTKK